MNQKKPIPPPRSGSNSKPNSNRNSAENSGIVDNTELKQLTLDDDDFIKKPNGNANKSNGSRPNSNGEDYVISDVPSQSTLPPLNSTIAHTTRESMVVSKQIIGSYVIGELIGKGGFASVFRGLNTISGDFVAIKRFSKSKISKEQLASISTELDLLQRLNHESIVRVLGKEENEDYIFLFIEYMENGSLHSIINQFGTFPELLLCQYIENVLRGLVYLHSENVVHRDIKAANILINKNGDAKLSDFGVAGEIDGSDKRYSVVGTPYWLSPEIIEMLGHSNASDIWSIGCTVIELLTGSPPYFYLNPMSAMFRIVQDDKPPFPKNISKDLFDFLDRCFVKSVEDRATAKELLIHPWITKNKTLINQQKSNSFQLNRTSSSNGIIDQISKTISVMKQQNNNNNSNGNLDVDDASRSSSTSTTPKSNLSTPSSPMTSVKVNQQHESEIKKLTLENDEMKSKINDLEVQLKKEQEKLAESERKYKEILLSSMHYIYIVDSTINLKESGSISSNKQTISNEVTHLRNIMRDQIESEYYNAYPDDNMVPRFIQRRLTRDTLIHIPKKALEAQKRREKEEKKKQEKKEKDKLDKEKQEKKEKEKQYKLLSPTSSSNNLTISSNNVNNSSNNNSNSNNSSNVVSPPQTPTKEISTSNLKQAFIGKRTPSKSQIAEISAHITSNVKLIPPVQISSLQNSTNSTPSSPSRK
ncbi:putative protein serine/threonine kinase [Tieghemostelium lacteum]|uniref:Protein kinase domain-containing protein n=1 Tax=Tieghemostelium lacteum TaxID=361077 RepID=A0A151Z3N6_TIELA|nr:putative protein serine/threonine kinase [Tieghemostelium lacteum]|eukprot:KYQ88414.1 putative protein serine/threonine kinase [Tieghemostelium lacteum]